MKLTDFQVLKCSPLARIPFAISWSEDHTIAMTTEKGIYVTGGRRRGGALLASFLLCILVSRVTGSDITNLVFGNLKDISPAAFGDFNSDEYPDLFVIRGGQKSVEVLLGSDTDPYVRRESGHTCTFSQTVTSVVPGDFNGDALMDVLVTVSLGASGSCDLQGVHIIWGSGDRFNCNETGISPRIKMCGQPLAMDYNEDMIIDLFGTDESGKRSYWVFDEKSSYVNPTHVPMLTSGIAAHLSTKHAHAFIDLTGDYDPDLFLVTEKDFEVWAKTPERNGFHFETKIPFPDNVKFGQFGQSSFLDTKLEGKLDMILPVCFNSLCTNSTIYVYSDSVWYNLKTNFHYNGGWGFVPPQGQMYSEAITLRGGDYNMDGYPDLLATLQLNNAKKTFLLMNEKCVTDCKEYGRTFTVDWTTLDPINNDTVLGVFYDFLQDGILDIVLVHNDPKKGVSAYKNSLDYDANFIKVMVITGLKDADRPLMTHGRKNRTFGTNLPGPTVSYDSTNQDDQPRASVSAQLPQSAYFSLQLPYTLFGLGRTPNFVDRLTVGVYGQRRVWTQIIPNSQMIVIPNPIDQPQKWTARLFVTPSKLIAKSFIALLGTCLLLSLIILIFWWKERREDYNERLGQPNRFPFDAM